MTERPFTLCVVTKEDIHEAIRKANIRLYYCSPGVDKETAILLRKAYERIRGTVYVHLDPLQHYSLDCGYGTEEGIEYLAMMEKAYIAKHWRLGLVIADDVAYIFSPTPESMEPPPKKGQEPNGVLIKGAEVEFLLAHILGPDNREILRPRGGARPDKASLTPVTSALLPESDPSAVEEHIKQIPSPKFKRLMNLVRRIFKFVRFRHSLTIAEKKIPLSPKDLGFQTKDIDRYLRTTFTLLTDEDRNEIKRILRQVDKFVQRSIHEGWIKSLHPYGYVVSYQDPSVLTDKFGELKKRITCEITESVTQKYEDIKGHSIGNIKDFLRVDVFPRVRPVLASKPSWMTEEQFRDDWVDEYAKKINFPTCKEIINTLKISYDLYDISEEMFNKKDFRNLLESKFEVDLDQLLEKEESQTN